MEAPLQRQQSQIPRRQSEEEQSRIAMDPRGNPAASQPADSAYGTFLPVKRAPRDSRDADRAAAGAPLAAPEYASQLSESDIGNLTGLLDHEMAPNTVRNYRSQWLTFRTWAMRRGVPPLPAEPAQVAAYLAERIELLGHKPATLRVAASAIAFVHRSAGIEDPCARPEVKRILQSANRKAGRAQKQAKGLTADALAAIQATACDLRNARGRGLERAETAERRGRLDIALIGLMRDAMLRVSEAAALTWDDLREEPDGTGRLLIRRSKTDPEGEGAVAYVSASTMAALASIRDGARLSESVIGLGPNQISNRIKQAALAAELGEGFSGHSPRVGMAQDLARAGIELPGLMTAGRWRSPMMPAHYTRNETASRGAVAQFYSTYRRRVCSQTRRTTRYCSRTIVLSGREAVLDPAQAEMSGVWTSLSGVPGTC